MTMICKVDKVKNVDGSVAELRFALSPAAVAAVSDLSIDGDLVFEGRSEHRDRIIHITGEVTLTLAKQCDRCGVAVKEPLTTAFSEAFTNVPERAADEAIHVFHGDEIELFPYVEQAIFLALPMKTLCKEDCNGLCPRCGTNLNEKECSCEKSPIDPRLAVLADLLGERE